MRTLIQSTTRIVSLIVVLMTLIVLVMPGPVVAQDSQGEVKIEWLTWSFFRITSPKGKVILTNPWLRAIQIVRPRSNRSTKPTSSWFLQGIAMKLARLWR